MDKMIEINTNILQIIGHSRKEVSHTKVLRFLLDPFSPVNNGKVTFLDIFIDLIRSKNINVKINSETAIVESEVYVGPINKDCTEGGILDIRIYDRVNKSLIIIENKIDCTEGQNQLLRYGNYAKKEHDEDRAEEFVVLFLTPNGRISEQHDDLKKSKINYGCLSYRDVNEWLNECEEWLKKCEGCKEMLSESQKLLKGYKIIVEEIINCYENYEDERLKARKEFLDELKKKYPNYRIYGMEEDETNPNIAIRPSKWERFWISIEACGKCGIWSGHDTNEKDYQKLIAFDKNEKLIAFDKYDCREWYPFGYINISTLPINFDFTSTAEKSKYSSYLEMIRQLIEKEIDANPKIINEINKL